MTNAYALTYDNLVSTVLQYLERTDAAVVNQMPVSIMLAEIDIATKLKILGQILVAEFQIQSGSGANVFPKPALWRKTTSMNVTVNGVKNPVLLRKKEYIETYIASGAVAGPPLYYGDYDFDHFIVGPVADQLYNMEVLYYARLSPLSSAVQTNWITDNAPQAMIYGTLLQFAPFLKNDQRLATWQSLYTDALESLKVEDQTRIGDRNAIAIDS